MEGEIFVIVLVAIVCGTALVGSIVSEAFKYGKRQLDYKYGKGENSLTTSELEALMRRAVEQATQPLVEKIEALEARFDEEAPPGLLEEGRHDALDDRAAAAPHAVRRQRA